MDQLLELEKVQPSDKYADGIWIKMGGRREYLVPALNFRSLRELSGELASIGAIGSGGMPSPAQLGTINRFVLAALKRNYPDITLEQVEELVDMGNFVSLFNAIVDITGLQKKTGETLATG